MPSVMPLTYPTNECVGFMRPHEISLRFPADHYSHGLCPVKAAWLWYNACTETRKAVGGMSEGRKHVGMLRTLGALILAGLLGGLLLVGFNLFYSSVMEGNAFSTPFYVLAGIVALVLFFLLLFPANRRRFAASRPSCAGC